MPERRIRTISLLKSTEKPLGFFVNILLVLDLLQHPINHWPLPLTLFQNTKHARACTHTHRHQNRCESTVSCVLALNISLLNWMDRLTHCHTKTTPTSCWTVTEVQTPQLLQMVHFIYCSKIKANEKEWGESNQRPKNKIINGKDAKESIPQKLHCHLGGMRQDCPSMKKRKDKLSTKLE